MALPLLIGLGAAVLGAAGHSVAKETNEKAQRIANDAQEIYDRAKSSLESAQRRTETSLNEFATTKKNVLQGSMTRFMKSFDRVKHIQLGDTPGLEELEKFSIKPADIVAIQHMADIQDNFGSGVAGVAAGLGLASVGGLAATSLAGLSAIAGPVMLFTAFSANTKADENLEKAQKMYAQAEAAVSKMKTSETLCLAIKKRSEMFDSLLADCNEYFAMATAKLENVISKRAGFFGSMSSAPIPAEKFTKEDRDVMAVAFSLAGTVKAVIDTPILTKRGNLDESSQAKYNDFQRALTASKPKVEAINAVHISRSQVEAIKAGEENLTGLAKILDIAKKTALFLIFAFFAWTFYREAVNIVSTNYFLIKAIGVGIVAFIALRLSFFDEKKLRGSFILKILMSVSSLTFCFSVGSILTWLDGSSMISIILTEVLALFLPAVLVLSLLD